MRNVVSGFTLRARARGQCYGEVSDEVSAANAKETVETVDRRRRFYWPTKHFRDFLKLFLQRPPVPKCPWATVDVRKCP